MISCVYLSAQSKLAKKVGLKFFVIYARLEDVSGKTFVTGLNHNQVNLHTKRNADCFYLIQTRRCSSNAVVPSSTMLETH